jgi:DNA (cytosine-5)-methyltransferase 1
MSKEQNVHSGSVQPALQQADCYGHVPLKHASLFSGIGGFDLAAEWMGWDNIFHCEINKYCQQILKQHFPKSILYDDIKKTDFKEWNGKIDIISGGFPCQPYSNAGKRKGKEDDRHLWPEMLRAIREVQPTWIVGENVAGLLNWNGGMVLNEIKTDLENSGFEVFPPCILPACGKNAPHRRDRLWIVAYSQEANSRNAVYSRTGWNGIAGMDDVKNATNANSNGQHRSNGKHEINASEGGKYALNDIEQAITTDTDNQGLQGGKKHRGIKEIRQNGNEQLTGCVSPDWENFPTQSPVCGGNDGIPNRVDRIKALGNAVVPQVVFEIFKALESVHRHCP